MTESIPDTPAHSVFRLKRITTHPDRPEPEAQMVFHLAPNEESRPTFQMPLGALLHIIDNLVVDGIVPAWRDKGNWRWRAGTPPRCGEQMHPPQEVMLSAIATRNRKRGSDIERLVQMEVFDAEQACSRPALVPVGTFLQCLCAAVTLGTVPPLDPNWVRVAIPDGIVENVRHQTGSTDG